MYRTMVVDDEAWVRSGLIHRLNNIDLPVLFCAQAGSGEEAEQLVGQARPDIVLVDICMSGMNGLEFIRRIRKISPMIQFIVISGYEDFNYARTAISLEVVDYVTKPVDGNRLHEALSRAIDRLDQQLNRQSCLRLAQDGLVTIEAGLNRMLHMPDDAGGSCEVLRQTLGSGCKVMVLVHVMEFTQTLKKNDNLVHDLIDCAAAVPAGRFRVFPLRNYEYYNQLIIVLQSDREGQIELDACHWAQALRNRLVAALHVFCAMAIGAGFADLATSRMQYGLLQTLLLNRFLDGGSCLYIPGDAAELKPVPVENAAWLMNLKACLASGHEQQARKLIGGLFCQETMKQTGASFMETSYFATAHLISRISTPSGGLAGRPQFYDFLRAHSIHQMDRLDEAGAALAELAREAILSRQESLAAVLPEQMVADIRRYIDTYYYEDISRADFSRKYNLSESYLSRLFHKYTGQSFTHYLNSARLKNAVRLLEQTDLTAGEIALSCGFNSHTYFCRQFKNRYHIAPLDYREGLKR
jgi:two-component system response regulator YesN